MQAPKAVTFDVAQVAATIDAYERDRPDKARIAAILRKMPSDCAAWLLMLRGTIGGFPSDRDEPVEASGLVRWYPLRRPYRPNESSKHCSDCNGWGFEFFRDHGVMPPREWAEPCVSCAAHKTEAWWHTPSEDQRRKR